MNRLSRVLPALGVLVLCAAAGAQPRDPYYGRDSYGQPRYGQPGAYGSGNGYGGNQEYLVRRVLNDLNRAASRGYMDRHERRHFEEAASKLQEFDAKLARGKFDNGKLDKAIENLAHLVEADRVRGADRQMLARDLQDLRQFRGMRGRYDRSWR